MIRTDANPAPVHVLRILVLLMLVRMHNGPLGDVPLSRLATRTPAVMHHYSGSAAGAPAWSPPSLRSAQYAVTKGWDVMLTTVTYGACV